MISGRLKNRAGTSLMEVLVVMVILVVGILVILRSYPAGFSALRHSENISIAGRLAQHEMEFWKNHAANLPEGILAIDMNGAPRFDQLPGPPMVCDPDDDNANPNRDDNVTRFRRVIGEVTKIPVGTYMSAPNGQNIASVYVLGFSPVKAVQAVYGGTLRGESVDMNDEDEAWRWLARRNASYAIDYKANPPQICFRQPPPGVVSDLYYITYSYTLSGSPNVLLHAPRQLITVNSAGWTPNAAWMSIPGLPAGASVDPGSESVARGFRYLDLSLPGASWTSDPYEYALVDSVVGILAFNPNGATYWESTEQGSRVLEAHIDYDILNLQVIHEDHMVPKNGPFKVRLSLPFIKHRGVTTELTANQQDERIYPGLADGLILANYPGLNNPDVLVVNPGDGAKIYPITITDKDYEDGVVEFSLDGRVNALLPGPNGGTVVPDYSIAGKNLRFYYQAENDWSVQLQKAYRYYTERALGPIDYDQFCRNGNTLYFKPWDCTKTVAVSYTWDDNGVTRTQVGESCQLLEIPVTVGGILYSSGTLQHDPSEIITVAGVSVKTRAVWREKKRWLHVDLDTSLTRRPLEQ